MIDSIDFCVSFIGENSGVLARVFFGTLAKHCDLTGVTLYLVNKQVSAGVWSDVVRSAELLDRPVETYELDTGWKPYPEVEDAFESFSRQEPGFNDAAVTAEWVVDNCGRSDWCVLSHFDVVWRADVLSWLRGRQAETGAVMVGGHCPIMLLSRNAYRQCGVKFTGGDGDVGTELARVLGAVPFDEPPGMEWLFHHLGGGGGYHTYDEFHAMRRHIRDVVLPTEGLE